MAKHYFSRCEPICDFIYPVNNKTYTRRLKKILNLEFSARLFFLKKHIGIIYFEEVIKALHFWNKKECISPPTEALFFIT